MKNTPLYLTLFVLLCSALSSTVFGADPGASINGYRWCFPCVEPMPETPKKGSGCKSSLVKGDPMTTDNFVEQRLFGGKKGKQYAVTLRFRGVVEPMMYKDGEQDGDYFYIGGVPNNKTYNIYKLEVSSPAAHFYLNRQDKTGHRIFTIDYTKTITVDGDAMLTMSGDGQNGLMIANFAKHTVPGVEEKPYNGQFIEMTVVKVEEL